MAFWLKQEAIATHTSIRLSCSFGLAHGKSQGVPETRHKGEADRLVEARGMSLSEAGDRSPVSLDTLQLSYWYPKYQPMVLLALDC